MYMAHFIINGIIHFMVLIFIYVFDVFLNHLMKSLVYNIQYRGNHKEFMM